MTFGSEHILRKLYILIILVKLVRKSNHEKITLIFDLPNFKKEDIKVAIKNKHLFIKATKTKKRGSETYVYKKLENKFEHIETLPPVDSKQMKWYYKNNTLTITIPKR